MGSAPSGNVTLLFTDIEGSTRAWEDHPIEMASALARHDALMTEAIEGAGGYVFKTIGDAFCAAFTDAPAAARAAVAAQRALAAERWPDETLMRVRMALHSGVCEERAGDYFGPTVNRVARLLGIGHGGQTLVSGSTASLLPAGDRPDGVTLRDLGQHRLRDLARPEHVYQLDARGLPTSFPPLRSWDDAPQHNLPEQLTSFVGRQEEMAEVAELIGSARLVTLTGPGGTGKTRIALEAAVAQLGAWPDGVWLVELASIDRPDSVAVQVGAVLQVREQAGRPFLDTLVEALSDRCLLLVVDSCEHVIDGAAKVVDALLRSRPQLSILATSREPLGVGGEHVLRIGSLAVPADDEAALEQLTAADAVRLFSDRAMQHEPGFRLDPSNASTVARVCRRLDGIPLAIELATARLRAMSLDELDHGLDQRFRLLGGGPRRAAARQQTLRATVDWSYDLLRPDEQACLARLSVFSGGFDLGAAEAVCGDGELDRWEVLDRLTALVDKSLVQADHHTAAVRFWLLETMRAYAADRLAELGAEMVARARRAHRDHYLQLAEHLAPRLDGPGGSAALDQLELEYGNLRVALLTSLDETDPDPQAGLRLAVALRHLWKMRGPVLESTETVLALLARPAAASRTTLRGRALLVAGTLQMEVARLADATTSFEEALDIAIELDDPLLAAGALGHLSFIAYFEHDISRALEQSERALQFARRTGDPIALATALMRRADAFDVAGDAHACNELLREAIALIRRTDNRRLLSIALFNASEAAMSVDDLAGARRCLEEAISLAHEGGNASLLPNLHVGLGTVLALSGEPEAARTHLDAGLDGAVAVGGPFLVAIAILLQAIAAALRDEPVRAATLHGAADRLVDQLGLPFEPLQSRLRDDDLDRLRASMGDAPFDLAYHRGRALGRAEAIALALEP